MNGRAYLLVVTVLIILVSGCSSPSGHSVEGTWKNDASQGAMSAIYVVTFRSDGTGDYKFDMTNPGFSEMDSHVSWPFTWRVVDKNHGNLHVWAITISDKSGNGYTYIYNPQYDQLEGFRRVS